MVSFALPQNTLQNWFRAGQFKYFVTIINVLLVIWLAWQLAGLSWLLIPAPEPAPVSAAAPSQPVQRRENRIDERQIAAWHLFGEAASEPEVQKVVPVDAPETRLKLTLRGVFASRDARSARAIVADPRGKEETYAVGDPLPGGAKLSEIYPDRIILERSGQYETLRLPRETTGAGIGATASQRRAVPNNVASSGDRAAAFQRYRNEIKQNPASFLKYVRAVPHRQGGEFVGFRLQPGSEGEALEQLGLQNGDVVTSINGVNIDTPTKGMQAMQALGEGDNVNVTLLRGGQEISLSLTLP
jgi:general secretion pathway protein C